VEIKFTKSQSNRGTENRGLALLLTDLRFQAPNLATKRRIVELLGPATGTYTIHSFDAVMTPEPRPPISVESVVGVFDELRLVEMKTTRKPIKDAALNGFFFGATEREYQMAEALGYRFMFAFIVLNEQNAYGCTFVELLTLREVNARTRLKRTKCHVNFRTDMPPRANPNASDLVVFGDISHIPSEEPIV
jgi:hypothetical protein